MLKFSATFGINAGYSPHETDKNEDIAVEILAHKWHSAMAKVREVSGIMVSAQLSLVRLIYGRDLGCPYNGEVAVEVTGRMNPEFDKNDEDWSIAVIEIVEEVRKALRQERVSLTFEKVEEFIYFKPGSYDRYTKKGMTNHAEL